MIPRGQNNQSYEEPAIFVGNLPNEDEEEGLKADLWYTFGHFGNIINLAFYRKQHATSASKEEFLPAAIHVVLTYRR